MSPNERSRQSYGKRARVLLSLLSLFKMSENRGELFTSTRSLAEVLGVSQQTASILLSELSSDGMILRQLSKGGERIVFTPSAYSRLVQELAGVPADAMRSRIEPTNLAIAGRVFTGKGEGAYYISQSGYLKQMATRLGFSPYPGTLNLRVSKLDELNKLILLYSTAPIVLHGFTTRERAFGDVSCYRVRVEGVSNSVLVRSERTVYDLTIVELISDKNLRRTIHLRDGDVLSFFFPA
ncbi:MAG TPA: DUF120 domain-containing protein [Thermoproteota archaeon]|nr:DUF120 domain-containing protein [Thermoproteota archaeon]